MTATNSSKQNRKFVEGYKPKGDGGLADKLVAGIKKHYREMDALTPSEKRKQKREHKKKMDEIVTAAKNYPGYDALFPNPKDVKW